MGNTFGTWLPGDPRGFRTRRHEEHVEGDYRFPPPPGYYDGLFERCREEMPRDAVFIAVELRAMACRIFAGALRFHRVEVVELSMGGCHWHLLAWFVPVGVDPYVHLERIGVKLTHERKELPHAGAGGLSGGLSAYDHDPVPRRLLGLARTFTTHELKRRGHFAEVKGGLWALRPKCQPVRSRSHQLAVAGYIRKHAAQRAAVLSMLPPEDEEKS